MFADQRFPSSEEYTLDLRQETRPITRSHLHLGGSSPGGETLAFTNYYMTSNGQPTIPVMGEFHFSRFPRQYWTDELRKIQAGGVTIVASYVFWIHIEEEEGIFDWLGNKDLRAFLEVCQTLRMPVLLRIGPFAHGECRNGGLPDWLYTRGIPVRSNDERYLAYVQRLFAQIADQVKGFLFEEDGPVLGIQLENEYMHCGAPWEVPFRAGSEWVSSGTEGDSHMLMLKRLAIEAGLRVPIYTCTGWIGSPVPDGEFLPMQGGYAFTPWNPDPAFRQEPTREFLFRNRHLQPLPVGDVPYAAARYPYMSCELGGGIQITYHHRPIVPPECVQAMALVALGGGANGLGYYMYHGGSNSVGKHSYLNEYTVPRISYDFQAPIREFGQLNESYHRLRTLHLFLQDFGEELAPMMVSLPEQSEQMTPEDTDVLRYAARSKDGSGFLFLNNYQDHVALPKHTDIRIRLDLPGESLTLPQGMSGLTLNTGVSAILPFNLRLHAGLLLKSATAQLLTRVVQSEQTTYVFFSPEGMQAEFVLDSATYRTVEVTHGTCREIEGRGYISIEAGLHACIQFGALDGTQIRLLVLTQEQAHACWKVQLQGEEQLVISHALVLKSEDNLHLIWRGQESLELAFYPPLASPLVTIDGQLAVVQEDLFSHYRLTLPEHRIELDIQQLSPDLLHIGIPATALEGVSDAFLCIDYLGDVGHAYLDGYLVNDHFANGLPWEIGLKRFMQPGKECEFLIRISPLQSNASALSYFPTGMAFRPVTDGTVASEVRAIEALTEYHATLAQRSEQQP
ncbi:MAG TPA: beta-galactosidase [Ktedonobacteraceae bacterium]|nr:beta-galactosidase [Ktedonobacteraceae bacterium]